MHRPPFDITPAERPARLPIDINARHAHRALASHGFWAVAACCVPMIVILTLVALKVV